jgi:hypothetical protein
VNKAIDTILRSVQENRIGFDDANEANPELYLRRAERKINLHIDFVRQKTKMLSTYVHKLESFLEVINGFRMTSNSNLE